MTFPSAPINAQVYDTSAVASTWTPEPNYTVSAGVNTLLTVCLGGTTNVIDTSAASVSFDGATLTRVTAATIAFTHASWWELTNPSAHTGSIDITFSDDVFNMGAYVQYFSNVDQKNPIETASAIPSGVVLSSVSVNISTSGRFRKILAIGQWGDQEVHVSAASVDTLINRASGPGGAISYFDQDEAGSHTMIFSRDEGGSNNCIIGFALRGSNVTTLRRRREMVGFK
jgi:hypothetical protein